MTTKGQNTAQNVQCFAVPSGRLKPKFPENNHLEEVSMVTNVLVSPVTGVWASVR
jgi:hypothetical protein